jgi:predicted MPP superfamily phosphohydrolase
MRSSIATPVTAAALGIAYAAGVERRWARLRQIDVPVLAAASRPLRILHISDLHMTPGQDWKRRFVRELERHDPDLVISTGDHIAHPAAVETVLDAFGPLLDRPGAFVFGSNDYYAPRFKNPARYLLPHRERRINGPMLPWPKLRDAFVERGWLDLNNSRGRLKADGRDIELAGVDDPHIRRDRYDDIGGPADPDADLRLGVTHSPEPRVLNRFDGDGFDLVLAGHTHGGQLRVPFYGALVTNCGLDRHRARGLSNWGRSWLHVSAGLGTSPYAPVRFACPPEATLLTCVGVR